MDDLYHPRIMELAADIPHVGRLDTPDGAATKVSRVCGSVVTVELALTDGVVSAIAVHPKACALGQASTGVLAMNDQRTVPTGGWGDDPFERELRALLRDATAWAFLLACVRDGAPELVHAVDRLAQLEEDAAVLEEHGVPTVRLRDGIAAIDDVRFGLRELNLTADLALDALAERLARLLRG